MSEDLLGRPGCSKRPGGFQVAINHQDGNGFQFPSARPPACKRALQPGALEEGRWRLRRTRLLWVLNAFFVLHSADGPV